MTRNEYIESITAHTVDYIRENYDEMPDGYDLYDDLFVSRVTGNDTGYFCGGPGAFVDGFGWEDLDIYLEACQEYGTDPREYIGDASSMEVTIRCYLLSEAWGDIEREVREMFGE